MAEPFILYLHPDGTVDGSEVSGTWQTEKGAAYMRITVDGQEFSGVFCRMKDDAGTDVTVFTAAGNNESVWGVKYD